MATTTARLVLDSAAGSLLTSVLAIDDTMTLTKLGSATGLEATTGLARQTFAAATETKVLEADDYTDNKAAKLYIKNTDTGGTDTVRIHIGTIGSSITLGWLDPDDWALIPWSAASDINVTCTSATTIVEWMLFYE
tara:strand:- start:2838 stop:3245 length:408 start_codon:yes stop_codon:yes gene_type:complete